MNECQLALLCPNRAGYWNILIENTTFSWDLSSTDLWWVIHRCAQSLWCASWSWYPFTGEILYWCIQVLLTGALPLYKSQCCVSAQDIKYSCFGSLLCSVLECFYCHGPEMDTAKTKSDSRDAGVCVPPCMCICSLLMMDGCESRLFTGINSWKN